MTAKNTDPPMTAPMTDPAIFQWVLRLELGLLTLTPGEAEVVVLVEDSVDCRPTDSDVSKG